MGSCPCKTKSSSLKSAPFQGIDLEIISWAKDSHGLYDYENQQKVTNYLINIQAGRLVRNAGVELITSQKDARKNNKEIGEIFENNETLYFNSQIFEEQDDYEKNGDGLNPESVWQVIRSMKKGKKEKTKFLLQQGQIIRIGKLRFRVKEMYNPQLNNEQNIVYQTDINMEFNDDCTSQDLCSEYKQKDEKIKESLNLSENQTQCRICFSGHFSKSNPLISPCNCSGSLKYIHLKCLQQWLNAKVTRKENQFCQLIQWKTLECELCKKQLNHRVECNNVKYDLIQIVRPESNYLILEILGKDNNKISGLHVINMNNHNSILIGRGINADLRISDISVSRQHCIIQYANKQFYLCDNFSKFGTLVLIKSQFSLHQVYKHAAIQIGRSLFIFSKAPNIAKPKNG